MRKAREIIGLRIIDVEEGRQLGVAKDIIVDGLWSAQGLVIETKHWFSTVMYIDWNDVVSFGEDAITVSNEDVIQSLSLTEECWFLFGGERKITGRPILTVNGQQLGNVEDVYFSDNMVKKIVGYELSEGFLSDLKDGRKWLPIPVKVTLGEDAVIVPTQCQQELQIISTKE